MLSRIILLAMLFATSAAAQQQEERMMDRIMNPDRDRANPMGRKAFTAKPFEGRAFQEGGEYRGVKAARTEGFTTREFLGIRNPWFGKKVYAIEAARDLDRYVLADRDYSSRSFETRAAVDGGRSVALREATGKDNTREFVVRGKAQGSIDLVNPSEGSLTIDQVRELLNRPR